MLLQCFSKTKLYVKNNTISVGKLSQQTENFVTELTEFES